MRVRAKDLKDEVEMTASKSSGPGGQSVNKTNSKITLKFDVENSSVLNNSQKKTISQKLKSRITKEGMLVISSDAKRTQLQNKDAVIKKLDKLLAKAFKTKKKRKFQPPKASKKKRLKDKKHHSEKKQMRKRII